MLSVITSDDVTKKNPQQGLPKPKPKKKAK